MNVKQVKGFVIKLACVVIVICALVITIQRGDQAKQARLSAERAAEWKKEVEAAATPIFIKPWDNYIECGIQQHDLRACDMRNWPGQIYPDERIAGEKSAGIVWSCQLENDPDRRLPPHKICYADASDARKRAYPCPSLSTTGSALTEDEHCAPANDSHSRMLRGENYLAGSLNGTPFIMIGYQDREPVASIVWPKRSAEKDGMGVVQGASEAPRYGMTGPQLQRSSNNQIIIQSCHSASHHYSSCRA